jgi:hypothetical protein
MAWRGHEKSVCTVRAGADIYQTVTKSQPEEGMRMFAPLRLAVRCTGTRLHLLEEAANASAAAVGPRTRRRSCAPLQEIPAKWRKALKTAKTLPWSVVEAAGAYTEAIEYPVDA